MGAVDFRVGGRIFATLASVEEGFGNLMLTPEIQAEFVGEAHGLHGKQGRSQPGQVQPRVVEQPTVPVGPCRRLGEQLPMHPLHDGLERRVGMMDRQREEREIRVIRAAELHSRCRRKVLRQRAAILPQFPQQQDQRGHQ